MPRKRTKPEYSTFTIKIRPSTRDKLVALKIIPRESLDAVIIRYITGPQAKYVPKR